ncbi:WSC domain-containing protein [Geomesophilobacter sediminis]|uniref:WSC domain-containing protein n=1 Tax=Geomesophilobacter sediminis TaxID=2798584 RepID=A0A8J7LVH5_9BACT|nr:WSC domain-containing protein [Geomesophilobacter sediminis]MBJ6725035.1 WSC domain-containing protein [Geomesophilobacter sediminis]
MDSTFEKVDKYLYGNDHGQPPADAQPPARQAPPEDAPPPPVRSLPPLTSAPAGGYLGCFKDDSRRDLKEKEWSDGKMTPTLCINYCRDEGFPYAGVQYGSQCFCGNRYGKYGQIPEKNCKTACAGDSDLDCGGTWANAVYAVANASAPASAPPPPVASAASVAGATPLGCYKDESRRDLKEKSWSDGKMTPAKCINFCRDEGFAFAGVQYGSQCFCGNRYGKYGQLPDKKCKTACAGDSDLDCGGTWANFIYQIGSGSPAGVLR